MVMEFLYSVCMASDLHIRHIMNSYAMTNPGKQTANKLELVLLFYLTIQFPYWLIYT